jgi:PKD repeat protein
MLNVSIWNSSLYDDWMILPNNFTKLQAQDLWQFSYTSSKTIKPGMYDLRISAVDNDNEETILKQTKAFEIFNNAPVIERMILDPSSILRRDYTTIFIYGTDVETERENMVVEIQYKLDFEAIEWSDLADPTVKSTHWEAVFYSNIKTLSGNYTFRARLKDEHGVWTEFLYSETELKVLNNLPIATHNFEVEIYEATEDEEITFDALSSTDIEDSIPTTFLWDFDDGTSSQEATIKHSYSKAGDYIVNLTVYDTNFGSNSTTIKIKIYNIPPTAVTEVDKIQAKVNEPITFDGSKSSDTESDALNLTYFWDFNDGTNSTQAKVSHAFNTSGTYSVSFMVIDDDSVSDLTSMYITIEPITITKKDKADENWMSDLNFIIILILLIIVILIVIGTLAWVFRKRLVKEAGAQEGRAKPEVSEKGVETVEADIVGVPEHVAEKGIKAGKSVKPLPTTSKLDKTKAPTFDELEKVPELPAISTIGVTSEPGKEGEEVIVPEVEVEFVPEVRAPSTAPLDTAELLETIELPHDEEESKLPEDLEVSLPDITDEGLEDSDAEFVPPKIDIPIPSDQIIQPELEEEIVEAKKRGEGISFDFKRPDQEKKKK